VTITLYSKPGCQPCRATKRWLDNRSVDYQTVDVTTSPVDLDAIKALGYEGVPVVIVSGRTAETDLHWQGFHPDNLTKYTLTEQAA
jgi:glutaredoxin-like protein NrdH